MDDIPETIPMKKSGTHSFALPSISKTQSKIPNYKTARSNTTRHHSVFIDKIKNLTKDVRYEEMETKKITEQQLQLKGLIRQFNQETYNILNRYIDRPVEMESSKKPRATSVSMMEIKDKQLSNSNQALQICKREMELLEKKCENLKYVTVQDFQRKIESLKIEIQQLRNSNKEIIKGNTLRGLQIKRGDSKVSHEVSQIEQQKFILQKKKERLTEEVKFVTDEQEKLKQSHNKADEEIKKITQEFNKYQKESKDTKDQKELAKAYEEKKKQYGLRKQRITGKSESEVTVPPNEEKNQNLEKNLTVLLQKQMEKQKPKQEATTDKLKQQKSIKQKQGSTELKGKKQAIKPNTSRYQYQYLKLLRDFDEVTKRLKGQDESIKEFTSKIENSKRQVLEYEQKLQSAKKPVQPPLNNTSQINDKNKQDGGQEKKDDGNKKWSFF